MNKPFNLPQCLQLAEQGDLDAQLKLTHYYYDCSQKEPMMQWFMPLLKAHYPPALLSKADFTLRQNPQQGVAFLLELAEHKMPGANYRVAMLAYFHPEIPLNFADHLTLACQAGEPAAVIAAVSLFYQLGHDEQAARLLSQHQQDATIAALTSALGLTPQSQSQSKQGDVDFTLLTRPSPPDYQPQVIADEINLVTIDHFLSDFDCEWLKLRASEELELAKVVDGDSGKQILSEVRNCEFAQLLPAHEDWLLLDFEFRIANVSGIAISHGELPNILRYQQGQQYKAHYDFFHPNDPGRVLAMKDGGQRVKTVLCYLNTPDEQAGGETTFPRLEKSVKGEKGRLLIFNNTDAQSNPLPLSLHQGVELRQGEKWLFSKWYREQATSYTDALLKLHL